MWSERKASQEGIPSGQRCIAQVVITEKKMKKTSQGDGGHGFLIVYGPSLPAYQDSKPKSKVWRKAVVWKRDTFLC